MALIQFHFESRYLQGNTLVNIILPDLPERFSPEEFYENGKKYPVLWLLHGTFGDATDWVRRTNIELFACERNLVVVMPSALNSNYSNWDGYMLGYSMYDYLTEELMPLIYGWLPVSKKREENFICGLSMGARGAVKYAVNFPDRFCAAAILSQAPSDFSLIQPEDYDGHDMFSQRLKNTLQNAGGLEAYIKSNENTWSRIDQLAGTGRLPKLFFACGKEDLLYDNFARFREHATEIGLDATFWEVEGYRHEWRFWNLAIERALDFFGLPKTGDSHF